ncbi:MAG: tetratricopeptide repeat protein [Pleurocapsa sp. SU_5_0]|nr:tetratricopeptide repeat protein [Pleurocapsa sp. SU_5_0]NJR45234.1 tetratricopeptide repeat protein [Hyellaceae cyanobacterium CSU_1_1]
MNVKFLRLLTIIIFLLGIGGIIGLGFTLVVKHLQTKQIQQTQQANNLLAQEKYSLAVAAYDQLLKTDSARSYLLWANRGAALLKLNQYQKALQSCSQATVLNQQADLAWNCRGEALYHLGQSQDALTAFQQAIAINPQNATFWLNQNQVLFDLAQHEQALTASKKAIALLQSQPPTDEKNFSLAIAWRRQGQSLLELQQNQQALAAFKQSLSYQPNHLAAQQGKGIALYRLGNYAQAMETFERILQRDNLTDQQQAINLLYQGTSLCQTSQANAATQAFKQVLQLTDSVPLRKIAQAGCGIR